MSDFNLPVRPDLDQLKHQAKDLLRQIRYGEMPAIDQFNQNNPKNISPDKVILADAQFALARCYGVKNWTRLVQACLLIEAIWNDDFLRVQEIINKNPHLIHENARGTEKCNWGPPLSYAANLGRNEIVKMLLEHGAADFEHARERAALQGRIETAELLHRHMGSPAPPEGALAGAAYTLSVSGTAFALRFGAKVKDELGKRLAPVDIVLETDSRQPTAKHAILEMYVAHGLELPNTPVMALHRGRIDLLEEHLERDPSLLNRTFSHEEIYPPELGCHDEVLATQGTPLAGTTLLHLCVDYDEIEIASWLIERGIDVNAQARIDADGFGGHTALFGTVVSQPNFWMNYQAGPQLAPMTELLLKNGAQPNIRASLRKKLHPGYSRDYDTGTFFEYHNITPLGWGEQFHARIFVSQPAMQLIADSGGQS